MQTEFYFVVIPLMKRQRALNQTKRSTPYFWAIRKQLFKIIFTLDIIHIVLYKANFL